MTPMLRALALLLLAVPAAFAQTAITPDRPIGFTYGDRDNGIHAATILRM